MVVGNPNNIAFSIGRYCPHSTLRKVEIFLSGNVITNENNMAYVPSFTYALKREAMYLRKRRIEPNWRFMNLEDITDNFSLRVYFSNNRLIDKEFKNHRFKIVGVLPVESIIQTFLLAVKQLERA
ncbi:hypothetical protein BAC3_00969 [uncultured bacterium]|nr:hypothetical protein BAC3_00969 [uncultured bacterium]